MILEMMICATPYPRMDTKTACIAVVKGSSPLLLHENNPGIQFFKKYGGDQFAQLAGLLNRCFEYEPENRLGIEQVVQGLAPLQHRQLPEEEDSSQQPSNPFFNDDLDITSKQSPPNGGDPFA